MVKVVLRDGGAGPAVGFARTGQATRFGHELHGDDGRAERTEPTRAERTEQAMVRRGASGHDPGGAALRLPGDAGAGPGTGRGAPQDPSPQHRAGHAHVHDGGWCRGGAAALHRGRDPRAGRGRGGRLPAPGLRAGRVRAGAAWLADLEGEPHDRRREVPPPEAPWPAHPPCAHRVRRHRLLRLLRLLRPWSAAAGRCRARLRRGRRRGLPRRADGAPAWMRARGGHRRWRGEVRPGAGTRLPRGDRLQGGRRARRHRGGLSRPASTSISTTWAGRSSRPPSTTWRRAPGWCSAARLPNISARNPSARGTIRTCAGATPTCGVSSSTTTPPSSTRRRRRWRPGSPTANSRRRSTSSKASKPCRAR